MEIEIRELIGGYKVLKTSLDTALLFLSRLAESVGTVTLDIKESIRILKNYDTFYALQKRRMKEFISVQKDISDMIKGRTYIDKIKLEVKNNIRYVVLVLDKHMDNKLLFDIIDKISRRP